MKKATVLFIVSMFTLTVLAGNEKQIPLRGDGNNFSVNANGLVSMDFTFSMNNLVATEVVTKNGVFTVINGEGLNQDGSQGNPSLPSLKKLIELPYGANSEIKIISYDVEEISLSDFGFIYPIYPFQPSISKSVDPETVPFFMNKSTYESDDFSDLPMVEIQHAGMMRGVRIGRLVVHPFSYNPVQNTVRVYNNIKVQVVFKNGNIAATNQAKQKFYSPFFNTFNNQLVNFEPWSTKDTMTHYPVKYLIIADRMFETHLADFIAWKTKKGFMVQVGYTDIIGNTTTAIKAYITQQYNNGTPTNPAPTYVLFVGDVQQIPTFAGTAGSHVTDLYYCEMDGSGDVVADMYYGRFSAQTLVHLDPQLEKTLQHEKYTMPDPSYLEEVVLVAGVDASMAPTYGNGQINYGVNYYFNPAHNITSHTYLYGSGSPIVSNSPAASPAIIQNISDGVGYANYTAHCSSSGWADPSFVTTDIPGLANQDKYCFMMGNCCLSVTFDDNECFGEAILRASKRGAVGYIGGSNSTYWNEDYYYSVGAKTVTANPTYDATKLGYYDRLFHDQGIAEPEWYVSGGAINFAGNMAVLQNGTSVNYYWEIYHLMGDPSYMPYLGIPTVLNATYQNSVPIGVTSLTVTTEPWAYIGLTYNGTLLDAQYTGSTGIVDLDLSAVASPCTLDIVITKQNRQPHISTITVVPNNAPYVVYNNHVLHDSGTLPNGSVDYGETVTMDMTLNNVGNFDANSVVAVLSDTSSVVTLTDNSQTYGTILANNSKTENNAYAFTVAPVVNDQELVKFTVTATDGSANTWTTTFNVTLNAPKFTVTTVSVNDAVSGNNNGRLDPGETATIQINTTNSGHVISPVATGSLSTSFGLITLNNSTTSLGAVAVSGTPTASFSVTVDPSATIGSVAGFTYNVNASGYTATKNFNLPIGLIVEDFESNTFTEYPWDLTSVGNAPWIIINSGTIYEGNFTARSGAIGNGTYSADATSELTMNVNVLSNDTLSFFKKVSSEENYDFLTFYVDGNSLDQWSGEVDWSREAYWMTAGSHILKWVYSKDYSAIGGQDAAWVDFIIFPAIDINTGTDVTQSLNFIAACPNPFSSTTDIVVSVAQSTDISVSVFNALGQEVIRVSENSRVERGIHHFTINRNDLPAGLYFGKVNTGNEEHTIKLIIN